MKTVAKIWLNRLGPFLGLFLVYGLFAMLIPQTFFTVGNLELIARQTAIVGLAGLGMTVVMIAGGIDLSVGSVVALSTVVVAGMLQLHDGRTVAAWPVLWPLAAAGAGVLTGAACGWVNGFLITRLRVVPFIVTLGTLLLLRGAAKGLAHEQKIDAPTTWLNELLATLQTSQRWLLVPAGVWITLALALVVAGLLRYTRLGRHAFAIGSNEQTARLCGVAVERVKIIVYVLGGAAAGLAGLLQFSRLSVGDPTVAIGMELNVIAAVVIGGGSLTGGQGSVPGTIVGALIMTIIGSGCSHLGLANWVQEIITGAIIVIAVALDRLRNAARE